MVVVKPAPAPSPVRLEPGTVPRGTLWAEGVNAVTGDIDLEAIRESVRRDRPFGTSGWTIETATAPNLEYSLRPRGRPRRNEPGANGENT
jgi:putative transposase